MVEVNNVMSVGCSGNFLAIPLVGWFYEDERHRLCNRGEPLVTQRKIHL